MRGIDLKKEFISNHEVFDKMIAYGWIDGFGKPVTWHFWNRYWSQRGRQ